MVMGTVFGVILIPGLDSTKEEFFNLEQVFLDLSPAHPTDRLDEFARAELNAHHDKVVKRGRKISALDPHRLHRLRRLRKECQATEPRDHDGLAGRRARAPGRTRHRRRPGGHAGGTAGAVSVVVRWR